MAHNAVLLFAAAAQRFGVGLAEVHSVAMLDTLLPVPFAHPLLLGLATQAQHTLLPVFDLDPSTKPTVPAGSTLPVLVFQTQRGPIGLRVDAVLGTSSAYNVDKTHDGRDSRFEHAIGATANDAQGTFFLFSTDGFFAHVGLA